MVESLLVMRSLFEHKRLILLLAALALVALTVLAISLDEVPFRAAPRFAPEEAAKPLAPVQAEEIWVEIPFWKQLLLGVLLILLIALMALLMSPEARKRMFRMLLQMVVTVWALSLALQKYNERLLEQFELNSQEIGSAQQGGEALIPPPVFEPPQVSPMLSYLISFAVALLVLVGIWVLYRGWKRYFAPPPQRSLHDIARIARSSLDDLSSGRNSSDVIINCYLRMSDIVSNKQQIHREIAMTPSEFAARLEQAGLPGEAVKRLTRLFEGVRYGDRKSGSREVNEAVSCLKTILHYCGEPV